MVSFLLGSLCCLVKKNFVCLFHNFWVYIVYISIVCSQPETLEYFSKHLLLKTVIFGSQLATRCRSILFLYTSHLKCIRFGFLICKTSNFQWSIGGIGLYLWKLKESRRVVSFQSWLVLLCGNITRLTKSISWALIWQPGLPREKTKSSGLGRV